MDKCLNCDKELVHVEGRKKKKYCNGSCKGNHWRKMNGNKERKYVQYKTFKELADKFNGVDQKPEDKSAITNRINILKRELANPPKNLSIPRKLYENARLKEISELETKLT